MACREHDKLLTPAGEEGRCADEQRACPLSVKVGDDGPGLPEDRREEALKRGRRLDETKPGSGLGLNIVNETAAMYGGSVNLDRSVLGGLMATLRLPAV